MQQTTTLASSAGDIGAKLSEHLPLSTCFESGKVYKDTQGHVERYTKTLRVALYIRISVESSCVLSLSIIFNPNPMAADEALATLPEAEKDRELVIQRREWVIRDLYAAFEERDFAVEVRHHAFRDINVVYSHVDSSSWSGRDLMSTVIKWAIYNDAAWKVAISYYTETDRAVRANEKLQRRVTAEFGRLDRREATLHSVVKGCAITSEFALEVPHRADNVRYVVVKQLLKILEQICRRSDIIQHYLHLEPEPGPLIDVLRSLDGLSVEDRLDLKPTLQRIKGILVENNVAIRFINQMTATIESIEHI